MKIVLVGGIMFVIGFCLILLTKNEQAVINNTVQNSVEQKPDYPTVSLVQPNKALATSLISVKGTVEKIPWDLFDPVPAKSNSPLLQGDEILTHAKSAAGIEIQGQTSILLAENTDISLSSLVGERVLINQKSGTVDFSVQSGAVPLNVITGKSLLEIASGSVRIIIAKNTIDISVIKGAAKLGYVDRTDNTKTWQLRDGQNAVINTATRRVTTKGTLLSGN
jgi:hypothetical protein